MSKNPKIIVLNGFRRGGTNIVWNILESHPRVCSPLSETGQIIYSELLKWLPDLPTKFIVRNTLARHRTLNFLSRRFDSIIQESLWKRKLLNIDDPDNKFKFDGVPYTTDDIEKAVLCLKSVNLDIFLNDYFAAYYDNATFIGLMRNGYAICNGMIRRGDSAAKAGRDYLRIGQRMCLDENRLSSYMLLKFEDVLADPFAVASSLFEFAGLEPMRLDKLRLKSKRVLSAEGEHTVRYGDEDRKYWFDREQIWQILDAGVNERQVNRLGDHDRETFESFARPVLEHFGYSQES